MGTVGLVKVQADMYRQPTYWISIKLIKKDMEAADVELDSHGSLFL